MDKKNDALKILAKKENSQNPLQNISKKSLLKALKVIEEFSEEIKPN